MKKTLPERVSQAIKDSPFSDDEIASKVGVSTTTVWRWRKGRTKKFVGRDLETLADFLDINYKWLQFGKGSIQDDPAISHIESFLNEKGESYKGGDRTLSNVESKAKNLIRDLQSLVDDLEKIKRG